MMFCRNGLGPWITLAVGLVIASSVSTQQHNARAQAAIEEAVR